MRSLNSLQFHLLPNFYNLSLNPTKPFIFCLFSSFSSLAKTPKPPSAAVVDYLIKTFNFSETHAVAVSTRFSRIQSLETPQSVLQFFKQLGFSDTYIQSAVRIQPQILFTNVDNILKPKIEFLHDLGFVGLDLGKLISKNPAVLTVSLNKKLRPCIEVLKKCLLNDDSNEDLLKVLSRSYEIIGRDPESRLVPNIAFLCSCGIVGSQLVMLLKRQPRLFVMQESELRDLVSRLLDMGFSMESRMLAHGLFTLSSMNNKTFERKFQLFESYGFSKDECVKMLIKGPSLFRCSEQKLKLGIDFFLNTIKFKKEILAHRPQLLMHSMEDRVIPRYRVLEILRSKRLLNKEPSFVNVLELTEEEFLEKYIARFREDAEEMLITYKGHILDLFVSPCEFLT